MGKLLGIAGTILVLIIMFISSFFFTVSAGEKGLLLTFGKISDKVYDSGFHFKSPFDKAVKINIQTKNLETSASAASKDLQNVDTKVAVNYNIVSSAVKDIKKNFGTESDVEFRLIQPSIQDSVKAATALFTAEELITKRAKVSENILTNLREKVNKSGVNVSSINIINFDFSESFNQAIEAKVTAEQEAQKARNNLSRIEFEGKQRVAAANADKDAAIAKAQGEKEAAIAKAQGEAESIRIQTEAIRKNGGTEYLELKRIEVQHKIASGWNGALPTQMIPGTTVPFINVK